MIYIELEITQQNEKKLDKEYIWKQMYGETTTLTEEERIESEKKEEKEHAKKQWKVKMRKKKCQVEWFFPRTRCLTTAFRRGRPRAPTVDDSACMSGRGKARWNWKQQKRRKKMKKVLKFHIDVKTTTRKRNEKNERKREKFRSLSSSQNWKNSPKPNEMQLKTTKWACFKTKTQAKWFRKEAMKRRENLQSKFHKIDETEKYMNNGSKEINFGFRPRNSGQTPRKKGQKGKKSLALAQSRKVENSKRNSQQEDRKATYNRLRKARKELIRRESSARSSIDPEIRVRDGISQCSEILLGRSEFSSPTLFLRAVFSIVPGLFFKFSSFGWGKITSNQAFLSGDITRC